MKKILWTLAVAVAMISSCDINIDPANGKKENKGADSTAVGFNVYVNRGVKTKAGWAGVLTTDDLKEATKANGFGVFAYYGNGALYNETSKPDFMYDQQVAFRTDYNVWDYTPIKYWPNEFGEAASSEGADRLTFFAYAPYAEVTPSTGVVTGDATTGIIGMSRNVAAGDPVVMYSSSLKPGSGVDLCWGVAAADFKSSVDGQNNDVKEGYPFINVVKTKTGDRLQFSFHHALTQLNVQIDADVNNDVSGADGKTKIFVRSVTFNGFSMRGSLNLNSNVADGPIWYDVSGTGRLKREPVTVYDGRTDGMEGVATAKDASEKPSDLNPILVQSKPYGDAELSAGVTTSAVNLFNSTEADAPVMVIPTPGVPLSVTIVYDIETEDYRLAGYLSDGVTHGSSVENKITKTIKMTEGDDLILSSGKKYVVNLHLGLTSVKFDADVVSWDITPYIPGSADLPLNTTSIGSVSLTNGTSAYGDVTVWKNETISTVPTVKVLDGDGNEIPRNKVDLSWASSNEAVATVDEHGAVTIVGAAGVAVITCTASQGEGNSKTASYNVNVNEVTAIAVTAADANISINGTTTLTATLTHTGNGTAASWPTVSWSTDPTKEFVSVSPDDNSWTIVDGTTLTTTATATGLDAGSEEVTATVDEGFMSEGTTNYAKCEVTVTPSPLSLLKDAINAPNADIPAIRSNYVGKFIDKDGNIHDIKGTDDVGIIAYIDNSDLQWYYQNGSGANTNMTWNANNISFSGRRIFVMAVSDISATWTELNESGPNYLVPKPAQTTSWFVPTESQMRLLGAGDPVSGVWKKVTLADRYWSSSYNNSNGRAYRHDYGTWLNSPKSNTFSVRPLFAF